jgi:phosphoglucomutase
MTSTGGGGAAPRRTDFDALRAAYYSRTPDVHTVAERVGFATGGHWGSPLRGSFTESHVLAIAQAICDYRRRHDIRGRLFLGRDTHALSEPAYLTTLEVVAANRIETVVDVDDRPTPVPAISHAILTHNHGRTTRPADGIVITASHHPPEDGGIKYTQPTGGAPSPEASAWIGRRANDLLAEKLRHVSRTPHERARIAPATRRHDYVGAYVADLITVVDMDAIRRADLRLGVDPRGGASVSYWGAIVDRYGIDMELISGDVEHTMTRVANRSDALDLAIAADPDATCYGIVTPAAGLMDPNHVFAAAISYAFERRPGWRADAAAGRTVVASGVIDRIAAKHRRPVVEAVGFDAFVPGLLEGTLGIAGDGHGASLLRRDGSVWTTDADGIAVGLLVAELTARTGLDPHEYYTDVTRDLGDHAFERVDVAATPEERALLFRSSFEDFDPAQLAGDRVVHILTSEPRGGAPGIAGVKVVTASGWFAACPSRTDAVYTLYAESFKGHDHLRRIQEDAAALVSRAVTAVI